MRVTSKVTTFIFSTFFKEIYCTESIYSRYKGKVQNCSLNQFE